LGKNKKSQKKTFKKNMVIKKYHNIIILKHYHLNMVLQENIFAICDLYVFYKKKILSSFQKKGKFFSKKK